MSVTFNCFIKKGDVMYAEKQAAPIRLEQIKTMLFPVWTVLLKCHATELMSS